MGALRVSSVVGGALHSVSVDLFRSICHVSSIPHALSFLVRLTPLCSWRYSILDVQVPVAIAWYAGLIALVCLFSAAAYGASLLKFWLVKRFGSPKMVSETSFADSSSAMNNTEGKDCHSAHATESGASGDAIASSSSAALDVV